MSPEDHQRVRQLFDAALARPEGERMPFLQGACGNDTEVLGQVTQLLSAHIKAADFLEAGKPPQQHIGRYLVSRELGRGAMGIVYEAVDPLIGRAVAVKVIRLQADGTEAAFLRERLFREARSAGGLFHPGIAVILDVGQDGDVAFIAMEYVEGPSLMQLAARRKIGRGEAIGILRQTAAALDFAHAHGVVHRDIKPANIMLEKSVTVKVADFGIAKIASSPQFTQTGVAMGTPRYMSPEQLEGKPLDGKSDQFSLAVVAYELLLGTQPFHADSLMALAHGIVNGPRPSAHAADPGLPADVDQVFFHALGKRPEERYANCSEFVAALERALAPEADVATRATILPLDAPPVQEHGRKSTRYLLGATLAAMLLAAGLGYMWRLTRTPVAVPKPAPAPPAPQGQTVPPLVAQRQIVPPPATQPQAVPAPVLAPKTSPPAAAPHIARFLAEPQSIEPGAQAMLSWEVSGTTQVDVEPGIGKKPARYSVPITPSESTKYVLTAASATGTTRGETLVEVKPKPTAADIAEHARLLFLEGESKMRAKQIDEGLALLRKAGELGEVRAMLALGDEYGQDGDHRNDQEAVIWYRKAAEAGDVLGMLDLAGCYELGTGTPPDEEAAVRWYRKAASHRSPSGTFNLARMYEKGKGVPKNPVQARILYQRAADLGNAEAKTWLAKHHDR